jgi:hypothetical protein
MDPIFSDADARTLKLAAPALTREQRDAFLRYQQTVIDSPKPFSEIEPRARSESGIEPALFGPISVVFAEFGGQLARHKLLEEKSRRPRTEEQSDELKKALASPWRKTFSARTSPTVLTILSEREDEIADLHARFQQKLRS